MLSRACPPLRPPNRCVAGSLTENERLAQQGEIAAKMADMMGGQPAVEEEEADEESGTEVSESGLEEVEEAKFSATHQSTRLSEIHVRQLLAPLPLLLPGAHG